mmetsp:Transcript_9799/g.14533  ORF Transcript_9799/g.14533 Transcript_9799/m.14533 type:complete len:96 (-) Transcript_9799:785-1072(-)
MKQGDDDTCPIVLEKMTFNLFSHYLTTRKNRKGQLLSQTAYSGIRSSLCHIYCMSGRDMEKEFQKNMGQFLSGMKRTVAKEKAQSRQSLSEGKNT